MAFGQTAIVALLSRYLAEPSLPPRDLAAVVCAFQRLFFHRDAHFAYLFADADVIPRIVALADADTDLVRRTALRALQIALHAEPRIADALCDATVLRAAASEAPFVVWCEVVGFVAFLIGAVSARRFVEIVGETVVVRVVGEVRDLEERLKVRLAAGLEIAFEKCEAEEIVGDAWAVIEREGIVDAVAWIAEEVRGFDMPALRGLVAERMGR
jgi:hypothetical protein